VRDEASFDAVLLHDKHKTKDRPRSKHVIRTFELSLDRLHAANACERTCGELVTADRTNAPAPRHAPIAKDVSGRVFSNWSQRRTFLCIGYAIALPKNLPQRRASTRSCQRGCSFPS
jgi:hypothetical protein